MFLKNFVSSLVHELESDLVDAHARLVEDCTPKNLHDFRVSSRRLRTALRYLGARKEDPRLDKLRKRLTKAVKKTNGLRDHDAITALLQAYRIPAPDRSLHRKKLAAKALEDLRDLPQFQELSRKTERAVTTSVRGLSKGILKEILDQRLADELQEFDRLAKRIDWKKPSEKKLHKLRIQSKRLRYRVELFESVETQRAELLRRSKQIQKLLGEYRDLKMIEPFLAGEAGPRTQVHQRQKRLLEEVKKYVLSRTS